MHRIFITALVLTNIQAAMAMQKLRNTICKKPVTSMITSAVLASAATLSATRPDILNKKPYYEFKKRQIRKEIAQEWALLNNKPEFGR